MEKFRKSSALWTHSLSTSVFLPATETNSWDDRKMKKWENLNLFSCQFNPNVLPHTPDFAIIPELFEYFAFFAIHSHSTCLHNGNWNRAKCTQTHGDMEANKDNAFSTWLTLHLFIPSAHCFLNSFYFWILSALLCKRLPSCCYDSDSWTGAFTGNMCSSKQVVGLIPLRKMRGWISQKKIDLERKIFYL